MLLLVTVLGVAAGTLLHRRSLNQQLLEAALRSDPERVTALLNAGADPEYKSDGSVPSTPLAAAAWIGSAEAVSTLIERKPSVDQADFWGQTPLMLAAQQGHLEVVRLLLKAGANPSTKDVYGGDAMARLNRYTGPHKAKLKALLSGAASKPTGR